MRKTYRPYDPDQQLLLPAALQEGLPPDHLAYFVSDVVDQLNLSAIMARHQGEERGGPPYHPWMMVKVLLYGYCMGVASFRRTAPARTISSLIELSPSDRHSAASVGPEAPPRVSFGNPRCPRLGNLSQVHLAAGPDVAEEGLAFM